jgi:nuclear pore complex protein Nup133
LIGFIAQNGLLGKLSQTSRRHLGADAEMLAAAIDLWQYSNAFMNTARQTGISANPLAESIEQVMGDLGEGAGDVARLFFRERLEYLNSVLEEVAARVRAAQGTSIDVRSFEVLEANRILLTAYQAAHRCRKDTAELYRFTPSQAAFEAWTCTAGNIDVLEALFHATEDLLRERTRELGTSVDAGSLQLVVADTSAQGLAQRAQQELKSQLADLAAHALSAFEDRLAYLQAAAGTGSDANTLDRERELLDARYRSARPQMILPLLAVGRQERAFGLAERHRDFRTLTELCHQPSLASGSGEQRIRHYLRLYRKDFAFELYGWYVEQGKLRKLLEQEESESELLLDFLESTDNARIGWLHDIRLARYDEASDKLLRVADAEQGLAEKKLMLSLGKLSHIALLTEQQIATAKEQQAIEVIDDQIDLTNVHQRLLDAFESAVPGAIEGAELSAEPVVDAVAVSLQGLPTLRSVSSAGCRTPPASLTPPALSALPHPCRTAAARQRALVRGPYRSPHASRSFRVSQRKLYHGAGGLHSHKGEPGAPGGRSVHSRPPAGPAGGTVDRMPQLALAPAVSERRVSGSG